MSSVARMFLPVPASTTRRPGSHAVTRYSMGMTPPPCRTPSRYRAPTPTGPASMRSDVTVFGSHAGQFANSAMKSKAWSTGSAVWIVSCSRGMLGSPSGPARGPVRRLFARRGDPDGSGARRCNVIDARTLLDDVAEVLVVPSFTRAGFELRRRLYRWPEAESYGMQGRTVVLTGPTSGLGRAAAASFARMGANLVLVGRDTGRLERTRDELRAATPALDVVTIVADMASLESVRAAAHEIMARAASIDVVIDNAGTMLPSREVTTEGFERTFATMVLGPFILISRLLPRLLASPDGRIVAVTSGGMYTQALPLDDLAYERGEYSGPRAYARAKRAQVALVREWARRLGATGVVANAMHPGWAATPGLEASLPGFARLVGGQLRSAAEGVDTTLWLAAAPEARRTSGRLFLDRRPRPFDRVPSTRLTAEDRRVLWDTIVRLTGEPDPSLALQDDHRRSR